MKKMVYPIFQQMQSPQMDTNSYPVDVSAELVNKDYKRHIRL